MRAHVVVNRRARRLASSGPLLTELRRPRPGIRVIETGSLAELDEAVHELASDPEAALVLAGGDGSYMAGVSALARATTGRLMSPVAFAPGGTVGTIAANLRRGPTRPTVQAAAKLLDELAWGVPHRVTCPTLRVQADRVPEAHASDRSDRVGFILGAGLVARFFDVYDAGGARGELAAAGIVARIFGGSFVGSAFARSILEPSTCTIDVDGVRTPFDRVSLLCASVVKNLGLGLRLTYRGGDELDRFHVVGTPLEPRSLGPQLPLVLAGRPLLGPRIDTLAREVVVRFPHEGAYVLDGDLFRTNAFRLTAGRPIDVLLTS